MPDTQFWDDKLTEEVQIIQILVTSRDDTHTNAEDDRQIDKLIKDAKRTQRCLRSQTKMLAKDDPDQEYFASRVRLLDSQLAALESDWNAAERSCEEFDASSDDEQSIEGVPACTSALTDDDTQTTQDESSPDDRLAPDDSSTQRSSTESNNERRRPQLTRTNGKLNCVAAATKVRCVESKVSEPLVKRVRRGIFHRR